MRPRHGLSRLNGQDWPGGGGFARCCSARLIRDEVHLTRQDHHHRAAWVPNSRRGLPDRSGLMETPAPGDSDKGFSRREIMALAGAGSVIGAATALPTTARARGIRAVPLAHRRKAVLDSSHRTNAFTAQNAGLRVPILGETPTALAANEFSGASAYH